jgi:heat-inducible transcriptional repressor
MKKDCTLTTRSEQVLCSIVQHYIDTGDPVASGDISRLRRFNVSPATIRMIMSELGNEGYLQQPHTSAGRVPTERAFEAFVRSLPAHRVFQAEIGRIRGAFEDAGSVEGRVECASHMLTEMTNGMGITATIPTGRQTLHQIELIALGGKRVLIIVVTLDRMVRDRVVEVDEPVTQDDLVTIRNYVNIEFGGWVIAEIQNELRRRVEMAAAARDRIQQSVLMFYRKGLLDVSLRPEVHLDGAANVIGFDLRLTRAHLRELVRALEEKKLILELLEKFLGAPAEPDNPVSVRIGLGTEPPGMGEMSLIGVTVTMPGGTPAKLAVLGPMRMDYSRAMSAVLHVGRAFSSLPS